MRTRSAPTARPRRASTRPHGRPQRRPLQPSRQRRALDPETTAEYFYDNAVCESFFKTLKSELVDRQSWPTRAQLRTAVFDYIECFYNRQRRHSSLDYLSPAEYEKITTQERAA
jgi:transposase InsO family protein